MVILKKHSKTIIFSSILIVILTTFIITISKNTAKSTDIIDSTPNNTLSIISSDNTTLVEEFNFTIQEIYSSREEILKEKDALEDAYYDYLVGRRTVDTVAEHEKYMQLSNELHSMLYVYPPSENEILSEKERMLNEKVFFHEDDYENYKKGIDDKDLTDEEKQTRENLHKNYLKASEVKNNYNSGELTIDEALDLLKIEPSRLLLSYYEQIEAAKSDSK